MAKTRTIVAATLICLGWTASAHAQPGYGPFPPGAMPPGAMPGGPMPGMMPGMMPGPMPGMMPSMPPGGVPPGMLTSSSMPPGMMPMPPGGIPPGMMPPPLPPATPGGLPGGPLSSPPPNNAFLPGGHEGGGAYSPGLQGFQVIIDPFILWYSGARMPVTLTTGDILNDMIPGAIDQAGTVPLFGGRIVGDGLFGMRLTLAYTFGDEGRGSIDIGGFAVETRARFSTHGSDTEGSPLLTRPFFNPVFNAEDADVRAFPGAFTGTTHDAFTTQMYGAEANIRWNFLGAAHPHMLGLGLLIGPRFLLFDESYSNHDLAVELPVGVGNTFRFSDQFITRNHFYGVQIGSVLQFRWDNVSFDFTTKLIGGENKQLVSISGSTAFTDAAGVTVVDDRQGLYAMQSNIGEWRRDRFSVGGELGVKFGLRLGDQLRFNFGYTLFAIDNIVRPGDQIDRTINIQPLFSGGGLGVARPQPTWHDTVLSTHTVNFGFEFLF